MATIVLDHRPLETVQTHIDAAVSDARRNAATDANTDMQRGILIDRAALERSDRSCVERSDRLYSARAHKIGRFRVARLPSN
ncbi:hypothetical protein AArcMg_1927 [Natrarchaeobaculum sulfurireducens]|uniref:Uncharacterized protein n=1 Tax=Natrarchaeobaculum sulfurireducens TaxID=2044521 RepID=A0A346PEY2_9EURY|nr:hypothetical protein AArc1_1753 [Natrarchaeobaculum sulfurireducens]AXR81934.1 hypothetical protein AArcMg_1927 [Natrarchaeobaculum sulfurireducens]